jgi:LysM repeat protein
VKALILIFLALSIFGAAGYFTYQLFIHPQVALREEKLQPPGPPPPDTTIPEFQKCVALRKSGKLLPARDAFYGFLDRYPESTKIEEAKNLLGDINTQIFLSPIPAPEKQIYIVQKGDVLNKVSSKMKTTGELIMRANDLKGTMLRIGQKIAVAPDEFTVTISHKQNKVILYNKGRFFKQYPILQWPPAHAKKAVGPKAPPAPKILGKVTDKLAWLNGTRVTFYEKGYSDATHWIQINIAGCTLHSELAENSTAKPPSGGIVLSPIALKEMADMLPKGTPVTLE